jgi:ABC-type multidrug transport system fused ATPase/permease subunit
MQDISRKQLSYLAEYLRPHKKVLAISFSLSAVSTALGMVQPLFAKILIDKVLIGNRPDLLLKILAAVIALVSVGYVLRVSNGYIYMRYSARLLFRMREDLFAHLHRVPLGLYSRRKVGDLYSRIATDMADIQSLLTDLVPNLLFNSLTCLITAGILLWLNWRMALLSLVFLPLAVYVLRAIRPKLLDLARKVAESNADISHFLYESLTGIALIRAFGAEKLETERLEKKQSGVLNLLLRYQVLGAFSGAVPTLYSIINTVVVFGYGGYLVIGGNLTIGSLVAFTIYQGRLFGPLQGLMEGYLGLQTSKVALQRVREILDIPPAFQERGTRVPDKDAFQGAIALEHVSFAYDGEEPVLREVSFEIPPASVTAVVGPSGVGKTTICHLIMRLFDPDSGRITMDGIDLRELDAGWLRRQIALVSQDTFLFHTTILENIRYSRPEASRGEILEAAKAACIHDFIESLPQGYETVVGDRGVRLSGGQKQRISIARSILTAPRVLILDEATAFLDPSIEESLKQALRALMKERTVVVVSHRASALEGADQLVSLDKGRLAYCGPFGRAAGLGVEGKPEFAEDESS